MPFDTNHSVLWMQEPRGWPTSKPELGHHRPELLLGSILPNRINASSLPPSMCPSILEIAKHLQTGSSRPIPQPEGSWAASTQVLKSVDRGEASVTRTVIKTMYPMAGIFCRL